MKKAYTIVSCFLFITLICIGCKDSIGVTDAYKKRQEGFEYYRIHRDILSSKSVIFDKDLKLCIVYYYSVNPGDLKGLTATQCTPQMVALMKKQNRFFYQDYFNSLKKKKKGKKKK